MSVVIPIQGLYFSQSIEHGTYQQSKVHVQASYSHSSTTCSYEAGLVVPEGQQIQCFFAMLSSLVTEVPFKATASSSHYNYMTYILQVSDLNLRWD
jgi:hypothetical protein